MTTAPSCACCPPTDIVAPAVRSRLAAGRAPRRYAVLGSAVRLFAIFAVPLQAASVLADRVLGLTWASTHGGSQWGKFTDGFTGHGVWAGAEATAQWFLPLLWTVAYFALLRDRRRLAQASALVAALPTLLTLVDLWARDFAPTDAAHVVAAAVPACSSAPALCAAHHTRRAPGGSSGGGARPGLRRLLCAHGRLRGGTARRGRHRPGARHVLPGDGPRLAAVPRAGREPRLPAEEAAALAALGLLLPAVRITAVHPWLDVLPGALRVGALTQAAALIALTAEPAVVNGRDLLSRGT